MRTRSLSRRTFLSHFGYATVGAFLPELVTAAPTNERRNRVRIYGRVESGGSGVSGVRVSDGNEVVLTDADGAYTLISDGRRRFVWISLPDRYSIPVTKTGTASFYAPIFGRGTEVEASFRLEETESAIEHAFFLLADPQTQDDFEVNRLHAETVPDIQETLSSKTAHHAFGVACGDIMYDNLTLYPRYEEAVRRMKMPFFQVVGNHDLDPGPTDESSTSTFTEYFGPRYYSFDRGEVHYIVLDDVFWLGSGYIGYVEPDQLEWMERDLKTLEPGRTVVVFLHIPLLSTQVRRRGATSPSPRTSVTNRDAVYRLLEPFSAHVLSGHTHEQEHVFEGGTHEHVHGAVCGAWWTGDICFDGTPNGYVVYDVEGSDVKWRYKSTGKPEEYQIRTYPAGADPNSPNEIVANVWGWDPEWSVFWYEDGERRGEMDRRIGTDPLSERYHRGPDLPPRRTWVDPVRTGHLFYCDAPGAGHNVMVEAIDRWGNVFVSDVAQL